MNTNSYIDILDHLAEHLQEIEPDSLDRRWFLEQAIDQLDEEREHFQEYSTQ